MNTSVLHHNYSLGDMLKELKSNLKKVAYSLSREGRMIAKYNRLLASSGTDFKSTPMLLVDGFAQNIERAPKKAGGKWILFGGEKVTTNQIQKVITTFDDKLACGYI